jgi:hypothetical protein
MKSNRILAIAALSLLAAAGAQAENYDGVHPLTHSASRAEVKAQAVVAAHSADPYAEGFDAGPAAPISSEVARADVKQQAVVAAHSADPYADGFDAGVPEAIASDVDRSAVHSQAVATARESRLNVYGKSF